MNFAFGIRDHRDWEILHFGNANEGESIKLGQGILYAGPDEGMKGAR